MTPVEPRGGGGRTPSLVKGMGGGGTFTRRSSAASAWTSGNDTPLPAAVVPGGTAIRSAAPIGRVQFDMASSPALTPTWKSTSWNRSASGAKAGTGGGGLRNVDLERSPELRRGVDESSGHQDFDEQVIGD
jgi:pre-mRNA-splicing factor ATP-dependent RNA helicase DHX38/PRP16